MPDNLYDITSLTSPFALSALPTPLALCIQRMIVSIIPGMVLVVATSLLVLLDSFVFIGLLLLCSIAVLAFPLVRYHWARLLGDVEIDMHCQTTPLQRHLRNSLNTTYDPALDLEAGAVAPTSPSAAAAAAASLTASGGGGGKVSGAIPVKVPTPFSRRLQQHLPGFRAIDKSEKRAHARLVRHLQAHAREMADMDEVTSLDSDDPENIDAIRTVFRRRRAAEDKVARMRERDAQREAAAVQQALWEAHEREQAALRAASEAEDERLRVLIEAKSEALKGDRQAELLEDLRKEAEAHLTTRGLARASEDVACARRRSVVYEKAAAAVLTTIDDDGDSDWEDVMVLAATNATAGALPLSRRSLAVHTAMGLAEHVLDRATQRSAAALLVMKQAAVVGESQARLVQLEMNASKQSRRSNGAASSSSSSFSLSSSSSSVPSSLGGSACSDVLRAAEFLSTGEVREVEEEKKKMKKKKTTKKKKKKKKDMSDASGSISESESDSYSDSDSDLETGGVSASGESDTFDLGSMDDAREDAQTRVDLQSPPSGLKDLTHVNAVLGTVRKKKRKKKKKKKKKKNKKQKTTTKKKNIMKGNSRKTSVVRVQMLPVTSLCKPKPTLKSAATKVQSVLRAFKGVGAAGGASSKKKKKHLKKKARRASSVVVASAPSVERVSFVMPRTPMVLSGDVDFLV